jgi:hypothetical protein
VPGRSQGIAGRAGVNEDSTLYPPQLAFCRRNRRRYSFGGSDPFSQRSFVRGRLEKKGVEINKRLERVEAILGSIANILAGQELGHHSQLLMNFDEQKR